MSMYQLKLPELLIWQRVCISLYVLYAYFFYHNVILIVILIVYGII